jgi:hypothetical protein
MLVSDPRLAQDVRDFWDSLAADPAVVALLRYRAERLRPPRSGEGEPSAEQLDPASPDAAPATPAEHVRDAA